MMYKLLRKLVVYALILTFLLPTVKGYAKSNEVDISVYQRELDKLNEVWGTQYTIVADETGSYNKILAMTKSEFDEYMKSIYQLDHTTEKSVSRNYNNKYDCSNYNQEITINSSSGQRYYYDASNYLFFSSEITVHEGVLKYAATKGFGSHISSYPGYKCAGECSVDYFDNKTKAKCKWKCTRMLSSNISDATLYTISCTFKAGGGHIRKLVTI